MSPTAFQATNLKPAHDKTVLAQRQQYSNLPSKRERSLRGELSTSVRLPGPNQANFRRNDIRTGDYNAGAGVVSIHLLPAIIAPAITAP